MKTQIGTTATTEVRDANSAIAAFLLLFVWLVTAIAVAQPQATVPTIDKQSALGVRADVERAMWVWSSEDIVYNVGSAKQDFFGFCENPRGMDDAAAPDFSRHPVNHLFFYAHGFVVSGQEEMDSLRAFLREAHTRGIRVDYLDGEATWINKDAGEANLIVNDVLAFNKAGQPEERFDGVMLDVQPYTLRGWYTPALWNQYLTFLHTMNARIHAASADLAFGVSVPRWYDATLGSQSLVDVYSNVNYVAVLDYVDQERAMIESVANEIELGDSMNVRVYAGVETASNVLPNVTFQEEGWMAMEHALSAMNATYMFDKSFAGVAINNYVSYRSLRRSSHGIDLTATMCAPSAAGSAEYTCANADVVELDGSAEHIANYTKKDIQRLQASKGHGRVVLASLSIGSFLNIAAHPGAPAGDAMAWALAGQNGPSTEMKATVSRLMTLGFDGFTVDIAPAVELAAKLNDPNLERAIVSTVRSMGTLARETCKHSNAVIVVRGGESLLNRLDAESYSDFVSTVDGIMPTKVTSAPAPLLSGLDRDRFFIYASLENVARCGIRVFGDFHFVLTGDFAANQRPPQVVEVVADMMDYGEQPVQ